jgi:hypothetical protein
MKTIKIILSATSVAVLCFFAWSRSVATERATAILPISSPNATTPRQDVKKTSELRTMFWKLVNSGNTNKEPYDRLINQYKSNNNKLTTEDIAILNYLKKICKDSESFRRFKFIPKSDRISAKSLTEISID